MFKSPLPVELGTESTPDSSRGVSEVLVPVESSDNGPVFVEGRSQLHPA